MRTPREVAHAHCHYEGRCLEPNYRGHTAACDAQTAAIENARADGIVSMVLHRGSPFDSAIHLSVPLGVVVAATDRVHS